MSVVVEHAQPALPASICLPAEAASAAEVRRWLVALTVQFGLAGSAERQEAALLCVSELVANVACHARSDNFTVTVDGGQEGMLIEVTDHDPTMEMEASSPGPMAERGRGLGIVGALARDWGVRRLVDNGKTVWLRI